MDFKSAGGCVFNLKPGLSNFMLSPLISGGERETRTEQMQQIPAGCDQKSVRSGPGTRQRCQPHKPGAGGLFGWLDLQ